MAQDRKPPARPPDSTRPDAAGPDSTRSDPAGPRTVELETASLADPETLRTFVADISEGVYITTVDGRLVDGNRAMLEIFGASSLEELQEHPIESLLVDPERREKQQRILAERGWTKDFEFRIRRLDGGVRTVLDTCYVRHDRDGRPVANFGTLKDVTEWARAERALKESTATLRSFLDNAPLGVSVLDFEGNVLFWNRRAERMLGWSKEEVAGELPAYVPEGEVEQAREMRERLHRGETITGVLTRRRRKDGEVIQMRVSAAPLRSAEGEINAFVGFGEDVTERVALENHLRESRKMESIGRLSGAIAHDFNNLLTAIRGYTDLVLAGVQDDEHLLDDIQEIRRAVDRATSLTGRLLAFSRRQVMRPEVLDLNALVEEMTNLIDRLLGEDVELEARPGTDIGPVRVDPGQMQQVLLNLAANSRDAMPDGGRLLIETAGVSLDEGYARRHPDARPGPHVMLLTRDNGVGMDEETREHLFEPFFTTKDPGAGTGLGMSSVYGIVQQSGGHITVDSQPGAGTTFRIYLPVVTDPGPAESPSPQEPELPLGNWRILLVEDEDAVRRLAARVLRKDGHEVTEAALPGEALELVEKGDLDVDLLLTDVVMPGMNGPELADRLHEFLPHARVLYISGYTDSAFSSRGMEIPADRLLSKPFTPEELLQRVREAATSGASG